ncbi:MAG TPA: dienelactone hydrolase family protein, partial [Aggregatilineales bacterium]|nr:dienelactone hydrolase family protein [Aggregatilineales bacterium]
MAEQTVEFSSAAGMATGFLARPDSAGTRPGVVVIQEWWGINNHIKDVTRRFAEQGYVALAPDLYHGKIALEPSDAQKAAMAMDRPRAVKEIDGAVSYLKAQPDVAPKGIAVVGFCMGGGLALEIGSHNPDVAAVAAFYGGGSPDASAFAKSKAAILNICGQLDTGVTATIQKLDEGLKQYAMPHELIIYPEAQH